MRHRASPRIVFTLLAILLLAAALRVVDLGEVPPGLQHDEVFHAHDAFTVLGGYTPLWFTSNAGNEPLFIYLMAASTGLVGGNVLGIRLTAVLCGLLTVVFGYRWARLAFGRRVGLLAAALLAVGFWPVWMSRVGLRAVSLPPLVALSSWLTLRALRSADPSRGAPQRQVIGRFALAGLSAGLTLYTYPAAYAVPLVFAALTAYLLIFQWSTVKRAWRGLVAFWVAAVLSVVPLAVALSRLEGGYRRVRQTAIPLRALSEGDPRPLLQAAWKTLLMWTNQGDPLWRYNVAGRPVFSPLFAIPFVGGVILSIWLAFSHKRAANWSASPTLFQSAAALVPLWLLIGILPSAVTDSPPAFLRASPALPATYLALALGVEGLRRLLASQARIKRWLRLWPLAVGLLVLGTLAETVHQYFVVWPNEPEVQRAYRADLAQIAAFLRANSPPGGVAISTSEPHHLDRFIFDYTPHGQADIHWFDGLNALVAPAGDDPGWLFISAEPTPGERLQTGYLDHLPLVEERRFANGSLAFQLYEIPPGLQFVEAFPPPTGQGIWVADQAAFPPDDPDGLRVPLTYPVQFGEVLELIGYQSAAQGIGGEWLPLVLHFVVTQDVVDPEPWVLFVHLLSPSGELVVGRDFLAVPASTWRTGDAFIQLHDLPLPDDIPPGLYHLELGLYTQADGSRFPVVVEGEAVGDRLLLEPVEVVSR
jgi:4-amino-4-deoxy-L-arabinose transferase-like glycosyltransferase